MDPFTLTTPVVLLVFNRPETTARVFSALRQARPSHLLVVADAPRENRPAERVLCEQVRRIVEQVDWPCQVQRNYADLNLGCKLRVSSGLDWVFDQVEEAIILEDDCLPEDSFFRFCQEMLEKYRDDPRIASIGGNNFQFGAHHTPHSYYFSLYNHIWGWASWRRAWQGYDVQMVKWPELRETEWLAKIFPDRNAARYWKANFDKVHRGLLDTWDVQLTFKFWLDDRLSIIPAVNLVSNVGFGPQATHTKQAGSTLDSLPVSRMEFPLNHPPLVARDAQADARTQVSLFTFTTKQAFCWMVKNMLTGG